LHPYGVSKVAQDLLAAQYFANYAIPAIRIRLFKTTGPGKLGDLCSDLTKRAIEIERETRPLPMAVGNLTNRRSIVDVRDLVQGLWLAADYCKVGEVYNLGGDDIYSVQELVEAIRTLLGFNFEIEQRPELMRRCDEPISAGSNAKFRRCCNWTPKISISTTLRDMLEWWRARLGGAIASESRTEVAPIQNLG
jgi:nucleoside-diphosphate-sugar epimerase